jgi:hypothetical protein
MVEENDNEENIGDHNIADPVQDPRLRPHGQFYEDLGEVAIDPSVNSKYNLPFRLNWGILVINNYDYIKPFTYFLLLFPMTFLITTVIPNTNNNLRANRKPVTNKAELIRFFGLTLSMALDPTRGGIRSYWDDNADLGETIYQRKSYLTRFHMTRTRFEDLRKYLSFGPQPDDIVSNTIMYRFLYNI